MNKYYLHNGYESSGPFDLEEIKTKQITKSTSVWCEGMEDWTTAGEVAELKKFLFPIPPPIHSIALPPPIPKGINNSNYSKSGKEQEKPTKILGLNKKHFFIVLGTLVLLILSFVANNYQETRRAELDQKNGQTDAQNQQYDQKEIEVQNNKIAEQERIEQEKIATEKKQARDKRLLEIRDLLTVDHDNLENAKNRLNDASSFKLLRTASERDEEMSLAQNDIDHWKTEIEKLEKETIQLNQN